MAALLEMRGIVRRFGALCANDGIDLDVGAGEIVGLLGENAYLRAEKKFDGLEPLKTQMKKDEAEARARLAKITPNHERGGAYA